MKTLNLPFKQFLRFCLVGISNTTISYTTYAIFVYIGFHYFLANAIGFIVSVLNAYYWNNKYVFISKEDGKKSHLEALLKTYATYGVSELVLTSILLFTLIDVWGISAYISQLLRLSITVPFTFFVNKYWSFK